MFSKVADVPTAYGPGLTAVMPSLFVGCLSEAMRRHHFTHAMLVSLMVAYGHSPDKTIDGAGYGAHAVIDTT